jgi:hypothetical protein
VDGRELKRTLAVHAQIARAYADDRFPARRLSLGADLRQFAIAAIWVTGVERPPSEEHWDRVCEIMHLDNYRFWQTIRQDVPRFEPESLHSGGGCEVPMIRREGTCGRPPAWGFRVTNPADGTWRMASYCSRHGEQARLARNAEMRRQKAGGIPEPVPNAGGLLPCYFRWRWPENYAIALPGWKPPALGIRADDWPAMAWAAEKEPPLPRLRVIIDGEALDSEPAPPIPRGENGPALRLVRDDG